MRIKIFNRFFKENFKQDLNTKFRRRWVFRKFIKISVFLIRILQFFIRNFTVFWPKLLFAPYHLEKQDRRTILKLISHRHVLSCQPQKQSYNLLEFCISLPPKPIIFDFKIFHVGMQNLYNYNSGNSKMVKNSICANLFYFFSLQIWLL